MQADTFIQYYRALPRCLQAALQSIDVDGSPTDMYVLADMHDGTETDLKKQVLENAIKLDTDNTPQTDLETQLTKLAQIAHVCKRRRTREDQLYELYNKQLTPKPEAEHSKQLITKAIQHWRHYQPNRYRNEEPTTQRAIEDLVGQKWRTRLLNNLIPVSNHLEYLRKHDGADKWHKWMMLFGVTSANTVKHHCLAYEQITKFYPNPIFPWSDSTITNLFLYYINHQAPVTRLRKAWNTIRWITKTFGAPDPGQQQDLKNSYDHAVDQLTTKLYHINRKAIVPTMKSIHALERATANPAASKATRYAAAVFRYQLGCSGRFNDIQHVAPSTIEHQKHTIEGKPWQTKTKKRHDHSNHKPLICPKHSFTGIQWWLPLTEHAPALAAHESSPDYLLPQPDKAFASLIPRPCQYHTALKWLRHILATNGSDDETTTSITLHSLRLWAAETAFLARIDRDKRRYIGQWSQESTADVYTRDHRAMITSIWAEMTAKLDTDPTLLPAPRTMAPKDPRDPQYYEEPTAASETPIPETVNLVEEDVQPETAVTSLPQTPLKAEAERPTVHDYPSNKGGPLTIMINNSTTGLDRKHRIHFYTLGGRSIGCSTKYNPERQTAINSEQDYVELYLNSEICKFCNRHATVPASWCTAAAAIHTATEDEPTMDQSDSTDNESCSTNDTASEDEPSILT